MVWFASVLIYILVSFGPSLMFTFFTVVYPCYQSIKAIESKNGDDDKTWLAFWLVYSFSFLWEATVGGMMERIIPLYNVWRMLYFVYLIMPQTRGALVIYYAILSPILQRNKPYLEDILLLASE